ncbi:hypothetical protein [Streptomyces sp. NWU339]|uniref:hypothetical protein n=1 Tax=Streptomyces sp. NWU339 TaxID=2185284 RepID=UPI0015E816E1|nr:hypothetical protein [Streptomyces sp. NWU339]
MGAALAAGEGSPVAGAGGDVLPIVVVPIVVVPIVVVPIVVVPDTTTGAVVAQEPRPA